jgi:hypothetical protein
VADKIQPLLDTSFQYVQAKLAFESAIAAARRSGMPDDEIAHVTGLTVPMIDAVAGRRLRAPAAVVEPPCGDDREYSR